MLLGDIANDAKHSGAAFGSLERLQHDVDRELGAIFAKAEEIQSRSHLAGSRMGMVIFAMRGVLAAESLRNEPVDWQAGQFGVGVTK